MDIILKKYTDSIKYNPDPDIPALLGSKCSLFAQFLLTQITSIQYKESMDDFDHSGDITKVQTNIELYIANILFTLGYAYESIGIQKIFNNHHNAPIIGI